MWVFGVRSRGDEPVSRPTASKIPPQVPLAKDGGAAGGSAVGRTGAEGCKGMKRARSNGERCARSPGATDARRRPPSCLRVGVSAERVTPSGPKAERLARGPSRLDRYEASSGPASGMAGARGGDLAVGPRPKRSAVSSATVSSPSALVHATHEGKTARDPRVRERAACPPGPGELSDRCRDRGPASGAAAKRSQGPGTALRQARLRRESSAAAIVSARASLRHVAGARRGGRLLDSRQHASGK